jgi:hypothetical protein
MPSVSGDKKTQEVRARWRQSLADRITGLPKSQEGMSALLDSGGFRGTPAQRTAAISRVSKRLHLSLIKQSSDMDRFVIQVGDSDSKRALGLANLVLKHLLSTIQGEAQLGSGVAAAWSNENVDSIRQKKAEIAEEKRALKESGQHDPETAQRLEALQNQLDSLESDHMFAGFDLFVNLVGAFGNDSVKVAEPARVEKRSEGYFVGVIVLAAGSGAIAGLAGLLLCKLAQDRKKSGSKAPPGSAPQAQPSVPIPPPVPQAPPPPQPDT